MPNTEFNTIKNTFKDCLFKLAVQKIKYIESESLKILVDNVAEEFINTHTLLEFSCYTPLDITSIEYNKQIKRHCKRILANDYDCSGYLKINESYINLDNFSSAMYLLYNLASSIDLYTLSK
jgi:hypothetical protein